jgi:lipopolysaccharide biosynthesis glycosyltransferase
MPSACIVFLCDTGYLFASLLCARQARAYAPAGTDIAIFVDGLTLSDDAIRAIQSLTGVRLLPVPDSLIAKIEAGIPADLFRNTHINRSSLFRLFVTDLLDKPYDRILYLDGDMQVRRPLAPLLFAPLPAGAIAATPDWLAFHSAPGLPGAQDYRDYLAALGLAESQYARYFNAGMILGGSRAWAEIGPAAFALLRDQPERWRHHDKSALNHVCRDRLISVSPRWNFLRQYLALPACAALDPAIVHFVGRPKPWDGVFPPWTEAEFAPYPQLAAELESLGVSWTRQPLWRRVAYRAKRLAGAADFIDDAHRAAIDAQIMAADGGCISAAA